MENQVININIVLSVIENNEDFIELNTKNDGVKFDGIILMLRISNLDNLFKKYKEQSFKIINQIYYIFHTIGIIYQGELFNKYTALIWKCDKQKTTINLSKYFKKLGKFYII